jgi:ankyrin repeat protein
MSRKPNITECREIYNYAVAGDTDNLLQKLNSGLHPNCLNIYSNSNTPLYGAVMYGKMNSIVTLLSNGADIDYKSGNFETPINAAAYSGNLEVFDYLMTFNPNPNVASRSGLTPLMSAAASNSPEILTKLINAGALVSSQMVSGQSALHLAASARSVDCIKILIEQNPEMIKLLDGEGKSALESQIINGYSYPAQKRLEIMASKPNASQNILDAKLHLDKTLATMKLLLENGAPCSKSCQDRLFLNPDLEASAKLYGTTHEPVTGDL